MKTLTIIFMSIVFATLSSFAVLWAINPTVEKENVMASQGIRLIGSAVVVSMDSKASTTKVKVGDLLIGSNEQVFRVNELRKSQNNKIYVVVSWKYITSFTSYEEYVSEPYMNYKTYEINTFVFNKKIIGEPDLVKFYENYSTKLANNKTSEAKNKPNAVDNSQSHVEVVQQSSATTRIQRSTEEMTAKSAPRDYMSSSEVHSAQAYATAEVSMPPDIDEESVKSLEAIVTEQAIEKDSDPVE